MLIVKNLHLLKVSLYWKQGMQLIVRHVLGKRHHISANDCGQSPVAAIGLNYGASLRSQSLQSTRQLLEYSPSPSGFFLRSRMDG